MGAVEPKVLEPHQERVVEEKTSLEDKIDKLEAFIEGPIHSTLVEDEQKRLATQLHHMKEYAAVLGHRIAAFV
jgi:hypothetical protein